MAEEQSLTQRATSWPAEIKNYFDELHLEMKRVTWPPWKQVRATTLVVIVAVFAFAAYFMVVDSLVDAGVQKIFKSFSR
jgi:preprotein translocase subunit SecE